MLVDAIASCGCGIRHLTHFVQLMGDVSCRTVRGRPSSLRAHVPLSSTPKIPASSSSLRNPTKIISISTDLNVSLQKLPGNYSAFLACRSLNMGHAARPSDDPVDPPPQRPMKHISPTQPNPHQGRAQGRALGPVLALRFGSWALGQGPTQPVAKA